VVRVSVTLDPDLLAHQLAIRGLSASELADKAHLSPATLTAALAGKPIAESSLRLIARALEATPVDEVILLLLGPTRVAAGGERPGVEE
jgi:lambda repressor-like predicted transcriptional regulator